MKKKKIKDYSEIVLVLIIVLTFILLLFIIETVIEFTTAMNFCKSQGQKYKLILDPYSHTCNGSLIYNSNMGWTDNPNDIGKVYQNQPIN